MKKFEDFLDEVLQSTSNDKTKGTSTNEEKLYRYVINFDIKDDKIRNNFITEIRGLFYADPIKITESVYGVETHELVNLKDVYKNLRKNGSLNVNDLLNILLIEESYPAFTTYYTL